MRTFIKAAALVAVITLVPVASFAQATTAPVKKTKAPAAATAQPAAKKVASHTTAGTVKSVSDTELVITKGTKDQTFTVNASTDKKGTIEAGAKVSVHYTLDGKTMVATAITVTPAAKAPAKVKK
jgi:flagellar hook assembly protein FlgD